MFFETAYAITVNASSTWGTLFDSRMDFWDFILLAISIIVLFSGLFSLLYILWGWVLLILSGWKDDKMKPAINSIRYALIWLWVIVLSIFIFPKIAWLLWLDVSKYSSPDKIFREIKVLWDKIFKTNSPSTDVELNTTDSLPNDFSDL